MSSVLGISPDVLGSLLSSLIGGALALSGALLVEHSKLRAQRRATAFAIKSEITAYLMIVQLRQQEVWAADILTKLKNGQDVELPRILSKDDVPDSVFPTIKANLKEIGSLGDRAAGSTMRFVSLACAVRTTLIDIANGNHDWMSLEQKRQFLAAELKIWCMAKEEGQKAINLLGRV